MHSDQSHHSWTEDFNADIGRHNDLIRIMSAQKPKTELTSMCIRQRQRKGQNNSGAIRLNTAQQNMGDHQTQQTESNFKFKRQQHNHSLVSQCLLRCRQLTSPLRPSSPKSLGLKGQDISGNGYLTLDIRVSHPKKKKRGGQFFSVSRCICLIVQEHVLTYICMRVP